MAECRVCHADPEDNHSPVEMLSKQLQNLAAYTDSALEHVEQTREELTSVAESLLWMAVALERIKEIRH